jgi:hypothetical protein
MSRALLRDELKRADGAMMPVEPCENAVLALWRVRYVGDPDRHSVADGQRLDRIRVELRAALVHQRRAEYRMEGR